jgi:hypothetical protein
LELKHCEQRSGARAARGSGRKGAALGKAGGEPGASRKVVLAGTLDIEMRDQTETNPSRDNASGIHAVTDFASFGFSLFSLCLSQNRVISRELRAK